MASDPDLEAIDYFDASMRVARRLNTSPADLIKVELVRLQLAGRGIHRGDKRIPLWIAPILCRTPDAQRQFFETFPEHPELTSRPETPVTSIDRRTRRGQKIATRKSRLELAGAGLLLVLLIAFAIIRFTPAPPLAADNATEVEATNVVTPDPTPIAPPPEPKPPDTRSFQSPWLLGVPLLAALAYIYWRRSRRHRIRRDSAPDLERSASHAFAVFTRDFLDSPSFRKALGQLRRHRPVASSTLNVPATIRATIRSAGYPTMRFGFRPRSPDYLFLHERESPGDHLGLLGRLIATRLKEEQVAHRQFEYFGDPRRLQLIDRGAPAGISPLTSVLAQHEGARVILFQESHDCFAEETSPEWLTRISETERPALLNPRARERWGPAETRLNDLGVGVFSPTDGGWAAYGDYVNAKGNVRRRLTPAREFHFDLPESFARNREQLLGNEQPLEAFITELVTDLDYWLDEGGRYWLRALALFPYIEPGLTIHLGKTLVDDAGQSLLTEQRFVELARLPWLRAGRMPDWLRRTLARGLTPEQLQAATAAIQTFLVPSDEAGDTTTIDFSSQHQKRLRKRLLEWLKLHPESVLSEQLLIEALGGATPDEISLDAPKTLIQPTTPIWASRESLALVAALLATLAIALWQRPPDVEVPIAAPPDANVVVEAPIKPPPEPQPEPQPDPQPAEPPSPDIVDVTQTKKVVPPPPPPNSGPGGTIRRGGSEVDPNKLPDKPVEATPRNPSKQPDTTKETTPERPPAEPARTGVVAGPFAIYFDLEETVITPNAEATLQRVANAYQNEIKSRGGSEPGLVQIIVRIQSDPSDGFAGQAVIGRLGQSIENWLSGRGIPTDDIIIQSSAGTRPTKASLIKASVVPRTRRVDISIVANFRSAPTAK